MKQTKVLLTTVVLLFCCTNAIAQTKPQDGTIVETAPCAAKPKRTYQQYSEEVKKRAEQEVFEAKRENFKWDFERDFRGRLL